MVAHILISALRLAAPEPERLTVADDAAAARDADPVGRARVEHMAVTGREEPERNTPPRAERRRPAGTSASRAT